MSTAFPIPLDADPPCRNHPDLFFDNPGSQGTRIHAAIAMCNGCPWKDPCAEWALAHAVDGVWGATTETQRRRIRHLKGTVAQPIPVRPGVTPRRVS